MSSIHQVEEGWYANEGDVRLIAAILDIDESMLQCPWIMLQQQWETWRPDTISPFLQTEEQEPESTKFF